MSNQNSVCSLTQLCSKGTNVSLYLAALVNSPGNVSLTLDGLLYLITQLKLKSHWVSSIERTDRLLEAFWKKWEKTEKACMSSHEMHDSHSKVKFHFVLK